jgi:hypothetical protein
MTFILINGLKMGGVGRAIRRLLFGQNETAENECTVKEIADSN